VRIVADEGIDRKIVERLRAEGDAVLFIAERAGIPATPHPQRHSARSAGGTRSEKELASVVA